MDLTILGSGGCMVIPKPLCECRVCIEARRKGVPYSRTGPSLFIHDEEILVDTPAEIALQLNREGIGSVGCLLFTHLDPDHIEGFRVVEQIALDFRTWEAYPDKQIRLLLPKELNQRLRNVSSQYGPVIDYYEQQGFIKLVLFDDSIAIGNIRITAIPVERGTQTAFIYCFKKKNIKVVYSPCDIKPFPENRDDARNPDLLVIQPGIFENHLKHGFDYPEDHVSRTTLYTFNDTIDLAERINAKDILFVHLEEYWNRSHDDYRAIEDEYRNIRFAYDGMHLHIS